MSLVERARFMFNESFDALLERDAEHIHTNVSERNICGNLAIFMEKIKNKYEFNQYFPEVEYNRKQNAQIKTIINSNYKVLIVNPDLILHSRGLIVHADNIICIELKKVGRPEREYISDKERLCAMTRKSFDGIWSNDGSSHPEHVCGYVLGIFLEFDIVGRKFRIEEFQDGGCSSTRSGTF